MPTPEYQGVEIIPAEIVKGSRLLQYINLPDYPAATWTLSVAIVHTGGVMSITGSAYPTNGANAYVLDVAAETTAAYTEGTWQWQAYVTAGSDRRTVGRGTTKILANFAASSGADTRSDVKKMLDAIDTLLLGKVAKDVQSYSINNRALTSYSFEELRKMREYFQQKYEDELAEVGATTGRRSRNLIRFRLGPP
jgi:hypothetical protein